MRKATAPALAATTLLAMGGMFASAGHAAAASCATITITGPVVNALHVSSATVPAGGCVVFTNDAIAEVAVSVSGFSADINALATSAPFTAHSAGSDTVSVTGKTLALLNSSGSGTITVTAAPATTKTPTAKPSHKPTSSGHHSGSQASSHPTRSGGSTAKGSAAKSGAKKNRTSGGKISRLSAVPAVTLPPFPHFPGREFTATRSVGSAPQVATEPAPVVPLSVVPTADPAAAPATQVRLADVSSSVASQNRALPVTIAILMLLAVSTAYGRTVLRRPATVDNGPGSSGTL